MAPARYHAFDAVRGIAAIAVAFYHSATSFAANGFLAVDIFFLMSGFIMGRVYETRLNSGMPFREFVGRRFARLFPVFLLGAYLSIARDGNVLAIMMLPQFSGEGYFFPGNVALWSLPYEFFASLVFASILFRLSNNQLAFFVIIWAITWSWGTIHTGVLNAGSDWETGLLGMARLLLGFSLGLLISRLIDERSFSRLAWLVLLTIAAFLFANYVDRYIVVVSGMIFFPAAIYTLAKFELPANTHLVSKWLGNISYPLYAVHVPILAWTKPLIGSIGAVALSIAVAVLVYLLVDKPGNRILLNFLTAKGK